MLQEIKVRKAAQHNLKNIDLELPRNRLVLITGPSGSGKSSLAFDTLLPKVRGVILNVFRPMPGNLSSSWKSQRLNRLKDYRLLFQLIKKP